MFLTGKTNRPAQPRHKLVFGALIVVIRVVLAQEVSPDPKGTLVRLSELWNILHFGKAAELTLQLYTRPDGIIAINLCELNGSSALSLGLSLPIWAISLGVAGLGSVELPYPDVHLVLFQLAVVPFQINRTLLAVVDHEDADVLALIGERSVLEAHGRVDEIVDKLLQSVIVQLVQTCRSQ